MFAWLVLGPHGVRWVHADTTGGACERYREAFDLALTEEIEVIEITEAVMICNNCERCTWNPGDDCGRSEHPHCVDCGHCLFRHVDQEAVRT